MRGHQAWQAGIGHPCAPGSGKRRAARSDAPYRSADERRPMGEALRDAAPSTGHAGWRPSKHRED